MTREQIIDTLALDGTRAKGNQLVRIYRPAPQFWDLWRISKDEIKNLGFSVRRREVDQEFEVSLTAEVDDPVPEPKEKTLTGHMEDFKKEWRREADRWFHKMRGLVNDAPDPIDQTKPQDEP